MLARDKLAHFCQRYLVDITPEILDFFGDDAGNFFHALFLALFGTLRLDLLVLEVLQHHFGTLYSKGQY
jgi:hypothetical protein